MSSTLYTYENSNISGLKFTELKDHFVSQTYGNEGIHLNFVSIL